MRICFDLDGVLCDGARTLKCGTVDYSRCKPLPGAAGVLRGYAKFGHTVIITMQRGGPNVDLDQMMAFTIEQLESWGFEYHHLWHKPAADLYITNNTMSSQQFWDNRLERPEWP